MNQIKPKPRFPKSTTLAKRNLKIFERFQWLLNNQAYGTSTAAYDQLNLEYPNLSRNSIKQIVSETKRHLQHK